MLDDLLARLEREREDADRRYNDALTALDHLVRKAPPLPAMPPLPAADALEALGGAAKTAPEEPAASDRSLKGRARGFIWRMVGPALQRQDTFNAAVVERLQANEAVSRATVETLRHVVDALRRELDALELFESRLLEYLRTVTAYIDTKDRVVGGVDTGQRLTQIEHRLLALKRELEGAVSPGSPAVAPSGEAFARADSSAYIGFEDRYRGTREVIRRRVEDYIPVLSAVADVVDIGCGRGELLEALKDRGIASRGVDVNESMVALCRSRGLQVEHGDALGFLQRQADESIGALVAIQVVEHFTPAYLVQFLQEAHHKMRPGAPLILETINPASWLAFFESYIRDLTHQRPLHPDTLRFLVESNGFGRADVHYRQPVPEEHQLDRVTAGSTASAEMREVAAAINAHAEKLNARLFAPTDYVVIARR
jgi:O-antigen chain-terminating methyltransferase